MAFNNAQDLPDWSVQGSVAGNLLVNTSVNPGQQYNSDVFYVAQSPSLSLTMIGADLTSNDLFQLVWYLDSAGVYEMSVHSFGVATLCNTLMVVPVYAPYVRFNLEAGAADPVGPSVYMAQSPLNVGVPTYVGPTMLIQGKGVSVGAGASTTLPIPYIAPGRCLFSGTINGSQGYWQINDQYLDEVNYVSIPSNVSGVNTVNEDVPLSDSTCALVFNNTGTTSCTIDYALIYAP